MMGWEAALFQAAGCPKCSGRRRRELFVAPAIPRPVLELGLRSGHRPVPRPRPRGCGWPLGLARSSRSSPLAGPGSNFPPPGALSAQPGSAPPAKAPEAEAPLLARPPLASIPRPDWPLLDNRPSQQNLRLRAPPPSPPAPISRRERSASRQFAFETITRQPSDVGCANRFSDRPNLTNKRPPYWKKKNQFPGSQWEGAVGSRVKPRTFHLGVGRGGARASRSAAVLLLPRGRDFAPLLWLGPETRGATEPDRGPELPPTRAPKKAGCGGRSGGAVTARARALAWGRRTLPGPKTPPGRSWSSASADFVRLKAAPSLVTPPAPPSGTETCSRRRRGNEAQVEALVTAARPRRGVLASTPCLGFCACAGGGYFL
ncbi:uncharacterized protein LOC119871147 isoform X1 [Canis lupus familiaris]|uniref:uncharacterized protein LOC119871147 isoform X1 n=1 Tax=Canis lupus familiaris TaxID=9615 RepID=UPI0018F7E208|nr:uncharacterized protein LOC119871147 isoform X1 [Canis lupus familiaris]